MPFFFHTDTHRHTSADRHTHTHIHWIVYFFLHSQRTAHHSCKAFLCSFINRPNRCNSIKTAFAKDLSVSVSFERVIFEKRCQLSLRTCYVRISQCVRCCAQWSVLLSKLSETASDDSLILSVNGSSYLPVAG